LATVSSGIYVMLTFSLVPIVDALHTFAQGKVAAAVDLYRQSLTCVHLSDVLAYSVRQKV